MKMIKVNFQYKGEKGEIVYFPDKKTGEINIKGKHAKEAKEKIAKYFNTRKQFQIAKGPEIDNFEFELHLPLESESIFRLALGELGVETGAFLI